MNQLYSFFKNCNSFGAPPPLYTHVFLGSRPGKFYLSASSDNEFYTLYNSLVEAKTPVCVAEKQDDYVPLLGDVDLKVCIDQENAFLKKTRVLYGEEELRAIVKCFQDTIKKNVVDWRDYHLICVALEKKPYMAGEYLKNGFHLHFPYLYLEKEKVKNVIIPKIKEMVAAFRLGSGKRLFADIDDAPENFIDDVTNKCWLMYGSSKSEDKKPYRISQVYSGNLEPMDLYEAFSIKPFYTKEEEPITVTVDNVKKILPQLLSISSIKKEVLNVKTPMDLKIPTKIYLKQELKDIEGENSETIKRNLKDAKDLLKILNKKRANEYNSWWDIGIILFNIGHGCEDAFTIWDKWSSYSDKYDPDACVQVWNSMHLRNPRFSKIKGMGSLRWYVKQDNLKGYTAWVDKMHGLVLDEKNLVECVTRLEIMTTDTPLARLMLDLYSGEYVFSDAGWYSFNGTIWSPVKVLKDFRVKFEHISTKYKEMRKRIMELIYHKNDDSGRDSEEDSQEEEVSSSQEQLSAKHRAILMAKYRDINRAINKLENFATQNGILKMCEVFFYNEDFSDLLDENPLLIAFKNGVFDFETLTFRKGLQSDYLSKTLNIRYDDTLTDDSEEVLELYNFLSKIFPDEKVRAYFVDQICEVFRGGNRDKIAMFWTGNGNNGKSVTQRLFETMIGKKLAVKLSTSVLTERIQPGQPNPQLTRLRGGIRWGVFDEWGKTEQILSGSLNVLTGGDSLPCRDLFQKGSDSSDFTPMFKLLCICNELPCLKDAVDATWDRIRIIPFESKFVAREKCPETEQEQREKKLFLCDTEITQKDRMESLARALGWYLVKIFKEKEKKRRNGTYQVTIPDKVNDAKLKYQAKCDILAFFMEETYLKTDNQDHKIPFDDMYISFKNWYINSFSGKMVTLNKHEFIEMVRNKYNLTETDKALRGYMWNRNYDDSDDE
ncbi:hypothetical protein MIV121R [Invertebrate iridescent virus 3]|uniref:Putative helicase 121R n=1 Tax=Invertebrate iridescent virus 3 TaxID=345201 RepID=VF184_IIV3|nr:DNA primase [Invertebrate iridescent virus 3]Q196T9.1 RecName: Full=Putative helicase 121R [Invertebrate iridescent virus 3]ABF82151.1 hypothetical protein MIV121R [Invertebrate iridescent virus 3]